MEKNGLTSVIILFVCYASVHSQVVRPTCYRNMTGYAMGRCTDKYKVIPDHINCGKGIGRPRPLPSTTNIVNATVNQQLSIVTLHNAARSSVTPAAANMLELAYNKGLESSALTRARLCELDRMPWIRRFGPGAYNVGENIYISSTELSWADVIKQWQQESDAFVYNDTGNDASAVANYTQMVYAETSTVGCGASLCDTNYMYVCHYAPGMEEANMNTPYVQSAGGSSCDMCTSKCNGTVCDCLGVVCLSGSKINLDKCTCDCINTVRHYNNTICELICDPNGDDPACGTAPYLKSSCNTSSDTMFHCPWLCDLCPYAGQDYKMGSVRLPWEIGLDVCTTTTPHSTAAATHPSVSGSHLGHPTNGSGGSPATQSPGGSQGSQITSGGNNGNGAGNSGVSTPSANNSGNGSSGQNGGNNAGTTHGPMGVAYCALVVLLTALVGFH